MGCGPQTQKVIDRDLVNIHKTVMRDTQEFWLDLNEQQDEFGLLFFKSFIQANRSYKALFSDIEALAAKLMKVVSLVFSNWENPVKRQGLMEVLGKLGQFHRKLGVPESAFPQFTTIFIQALQEMFPNVKMHVVKEVEHRFLKCCLNIVENYGKVGVNDGNQLTLEETQAALEAITNEELQKNDLDGLCDLSEEIAADVKFVWEKIIEDRKDFGLFFYNKFTKEQKELAEYFKGDQDSLAEKLLNIVSLLYNSWDDKDQRDEMLDVVQSLGDMHWNMGIPDTAYMKFVACFISAVKNRVDNVPEHVIEDMELRLMKAAMRLISNYSEVDQYMDTSKAVHIDEVRKYAQKCEARANKIHRERVLEVQKKRAAQIAAYEEEGIEGSDLEEAIEELDEDLGINDRKLEEHQATVIADVCTFADELESVRQEFGTAFYESFITENPEFRTLFRGSVDGLTEKLMEIVFLLFNKWNTEEDRETLFATLNRLGQLHRMLGVPSSSFAKFASCFIRQVMMQYPHIPGHVLKAIDYRFAKCALCISQSYSVVGLQDEEQFGLGDTDAVLGQTYTSSDEEEDDEDLFDLSKL